MTALRVTGLARGSMEPADLGELADGAAQVAVVSIIDRLAVDPTATHCSVVSRDGSYSASIPIEDLKDGGWLAYAISADQGGPIRLTVTEGSTLCWNVKDVGELRFTAGKEQDSVPAKPTH